MRTPNFTSPEQLLPAIIQDAKTRKVLMLGYMNRESYAKTLETKQVTFFSRSQNKIWIKGETSGNYLQMESIQIDCDEDTILVQANPVGPVCHTGDLTCFENSNEAPSFIHELAEVIKARSTADPKESYTASLLARGVNKVAQKVGEEAVELVIEAKDDNPELFKGEAADLLYHFLVLLQYKGISLQEVEGVLRERHQ